MSSFTHADYLGGVARVREYIRAGDVFQANLSQRFDAPLVEPPWTLYCRLRARNAAPFAAFLDFPDAAVSSASPERFLRVGVVGQLAPGADALDLLRAAFPGGSITGAPKVRDGDYRGARAVATQRVLRIDRGLERHRRA